MLSCPEGLFYLSRITVVINNQITVFLHHKALTLIITVHFQGIRECDHFEGITAAHQPPHNIPSVPGGKGEDPGNFYKTHFISFLPGYAPPAGIYLFGSTDLIGGKRGGHGILTKGENGFSADIFADLLADPAALKLFAVHDGDGGGGAVDHLISPDAIVHACAAHGISFTNFELDHDGPSFLPGISRPGWAIYFILPEWDHIRKQDHRKANRRYLRQGMPDIRRWCRKK